jgi:membrane protease YdiL (CAAX protease family)
MSINKFKVEFTRNTIDELKKNDGIISLLYFGYYIILLIGFGLVSFNTSIYKEVGKVFTNNYLARIIFYLPITVISVAPIFIILKVRNQRLETIGLSCKNLFKSLLIGIVGALPFSLLNINGALQAGKNINTNILDFIYIFLYFLICIAFVEEVIFRGFIQTRIFQLIKGKWIGIIVVGVLFAAIHIPFQMMVAHMNLVEFLMYDCVHLFITFIIHIYLVYLYTRYNNLTSTIIAHTLMDFSYAIFM